MRKGGSYIADDDGVPRLVEGPGAAPAQPAAPAIPSIPAAAESGQASDSAPKAKPWSRKRGDQ